MFGSCGIWCLENGFVSCCRFGHKIPFSFSFRIRFFFWFFFFLVLYMLYLSLYSESSSCSYLVGGEGGSTLPIGFGIFFFFRYFHHTIISQISFECVCFCFFSFCQKCLFRICLDFFLAICTKMEYVKKKRVYIIKDE